MRILLLLVVAIVLLIAAMWAFKQGSPFCLVLTVLATNFGQAAERQATALRAVQRKNK